MRHRNSLRVFTSGYYSTAALFHTTTAHQQKLTMSLCVFYVHITSACEWDHTPMSAHDCRKNPAIYSPTRHKHSPHGLTSACLLHDCTTPSNYYTSTETHHMINIRGTSSLSNPPNTTLPKSHMLNTWLKWTELNTHDCSISHNQFRITRHSLTTCLTSG